jgi:thioredoxin-dependent peroxiredoxin
MALDVGEVAPTFTLPGIDGTSGEVGEYALDSYRGQPVVLVFYPGDNTPICTRQLNAYTDEVAEFAAAGAQVLAISPQSVESHGGFAQAQGGFAFPLLADEGKRVGQAYGVVGPVGFYRRSAFVVDAKGLVAYAHRAIGGLTFRPTKELVRAVEGSRTT